MKFVVHDYHNNNSYPVGSFDSPEGHFFIPHDGYVTGSGITFFMLPKVADLEERTAIIGSLHAHLKDQYGQGITAVTCAVSDCVNAREFEPLFKAVKAIDPAIKTIEVIHEPYKREPERSPSADISIEGMNARDRIKATILSAVAPTAQDTTAPQEGWETYRQKLNSLYQRALKGDPPPNRPIRRFLTRWLGPKNGQGS